jgi:hypothetical protein
MVYNRCGGCALSDALRFQGCAARCPSVGAPQQTAEATLAELGHCDGVWGNPQGCQTLEIRGAQVSVPEEPARGAINELALDTNIWHTRPPVLTPAHGPDRTRRLSAAQEAGGAAGGGAKAGCSTRTGPAAGWHDAARRANEPARERVGVHGTGAGVFEMPHGGSDGPRSGCGAHGCLGGGKGRGVSN